MPSWSADRSLLLFAQVVEEKSVEELERIAEKKRESGRRLQEQVQKQRLEKASLVRFGGEQSTTDLLL